MEPVTARTIPAVGDRVRLTHDVDRYPFAMAPAGALGTVTIDEAGVYAVTLDETVPGLEEWENALLWSDVHEAEFGDDVLADLEPCGDGIDRLPYRDRLRTARELAAQGSRTPAKFYLLGVVEGLGRLPRGEAMKRGTDDLLGLVVDLDTEVAW